MGEWYGNSTENGKIIFEDVTIPLYDLLEKITVILKSGKKERYKKQDFTEKGSKKYGRCYQFQPKNKFESMYKIRLLLKRSIKIFVNIANNFNNREFSKTSLKANVQEELHLEISYEILKCNLGEKCKHYDENFTYDSCKESYYENVILKKLNCSVPYKISSHHPVCRGQAAKESMLLSI